MFVIFIYRDGLCPLSSLASVAQGLFVVMMGDVGCEAVQFYCDNEVQTGRD